MLELLFLKKDDLGRLWNIDSNSGQALSLTNEGEDLRVEVDIETVVVWVTNDKSSLETSLCFLDLEGPLLPPEVLVGEQGVANLVVLFDWALVVTLLGELWWELLHWHGNSMEEVAGPCDASGNSWQVSDNWWSRLELVVLLLN